MYVLAYDGALSSIIRNHSLTCLWYLTGTGSSKLARVLVLRSGINSDPLASKDDSFNLLASVARKPKQSVIAHISLCGLFILFIWAAVSSKSSMLTRAGLANAE
ncbi:hypothetical protein D3C86_1840810 [compost metagenome]